MIGRIVYIKEDVKYHNQGYYLIVCMIKDDNNSTFHRYFLDRPRNDFSRLIYCDNFQHLLDSGEIKIL